jgi:hypothetical protein
MRDEAAPSVVPSFDMTVHIVLNDFGQLGRSYLETDEENATFDMVVQWMLQGQFSRPLRVVAFNTAEGWSRDVSEDVAWEILRRASSECRSLPDATHDFAVFHVGENEVLRALNAV